MAAEHMDWATIITTVGSVSAIMGFFFTWMNGNITRLDNDIKTITAESKAQWMAATARTDTMIAAMNQRTDELIKSGNARFDAITSRIDKMLEKQGK